MVFGKDNFEKPDIMGENAENQKRTFICNITLHAKS